MARLTPAFFGPHPRHAVVPVLLVLVLLGWIAAHDPAAEGSGDANAVVATTPSTGGDDAPGGQTPPSAAGTTDVPVEALYGVPSSRIMHLWRPGP
jgi:hypothetical protein